MIKRVLVFLSACALAGLPCLAEGSAVTVPLPVFPLSSPVSSCALQTSAATPDLPQQLLTPKPEMRIILCGWCSESPCGYRRPQSPCTTSNGFQGVCQAVSPDFCPGESHVQCYCQEVW